MQKTDFNDKLSKKNTIIILVSILIFVLVGMIAIASGHMVYLDKQKAQVTNTSDFRIINMQMLVYVYDDGVESVDFDKIVEVNKGATFSITKIIDEDGTVSPSESNVVNVSVKPMRDVMVRVKSPSKNKTVDYRITLVSKSLSDNVINTQLGESYLLGDFMHNYSGLSDIVLPTPTKSYTSPDGDELDYQFMGWYTTPDYQSGTEITEIKAGSSGEINLFPQFAPPAPYRDAKDGFVYLAFGKYPQSKVTNYNMLKLIRASTSYANADNNTTFVYNGEEYYKFKPNNVPNLSDNGYSSSSYYVFKIEPIWWRVLATKNSAITNGATYTLLSKYVLNCSPFSMEDDGWAEKKYNEYASQLDGDLTSFIRKYYDPDTVYRDSDLRSAIKAIYDNWIAPNETTSYVKARQFTYYKNAVSSSTGDYTDAIWALSYSEAHSTSYGFDPLWDETDLSRQAGATDFALANGVYTSKTKAYVGKGSWWLRGAGTTFNHNDKKIAYVKYTGKEHSYSARSYTLRSGVRPSMNIATWFSVA